MQELIWIDLLMAQIICKSHLKTMNIYNNPPPIEQSILGSILIPVTK